MLGKMRVNKTTEKNTIEMYAEWYFQELLEAGYISRWEREPETLTVEYGLKRYRVVYAKKSTKIEEYNLLPEITYTPDYIVYWAEKAHGIFYENVKDQNQFNAPFLSNSITRIQYSYIDVKPTSAVSQRTGRVGSSRSFPLIQRMLMGRGIYVQKMVPIPMAGSGITIAAFTKTFTPKRYLFTDGGGKPRKINFPVRTMSTYIAERLTAIERFKSLLNAGPH